MHARTISTIVILVLLAATAVADQTDCADGNPPVAGLLERAADSYAENRLEQTLLLLECAQAMIAAELEGSGRPVEEVPYRSNAIDLLMYLDAYRAYALGTDLENDAAWSFLTRVLTMVADVESFPDPPDEWQGSRVSTWGDGRVHQIGGVNISHWGDGRIHQVGGYNIGYWSGGRPYGIGSINYGYMGADHRLDSVGGVNID